jgi:two-component system CheB/CheR fusion protein
VIEPEAAGALPSGHSALASRLKIVGIGTSAGGLEAATALLEALPDETGMAFILIQHLDTSQKSLMVELLVRHTKMTIREAADGMTIESEHLYIIPPGAYLSVAKGRLHLSSPPVRHGARAPFDYLLASMAKAYGTKAACIVLSGTGADGSAGLVAIKQAGGLVLVQQPEEAGFDGMPRNAIATGKADTVLPITGIAFALMAHRSATEGADRSNAGSVAGIADCNWPEIIGLLRTRTGQDFNLYKTGTLQRRAERRMALAGLSANDLGRYRQHLEDDPEEIGLLAKDLLINVTSFFRDISVFERLVEATIPAMVDAHPTDRPLRVWVAGCSTGEETYSLTMLFLERIEASGRGLKLQVFGSDLDADAIAIARDGLYSDAAVAAIAPERLLRYFAREGSDWRANPQLRACIVFTIQDILADPPFSRLDFVSCRNLLIYLRTEAQARVIKLFHFALCEDGILLLGNAENVVEADGLFETVEKSERIFRRLGRSRFARDRPQQGRLRPLSDEVRPRASSPSARLAVRPAAMAELGRRLVIESYAPASILIDAANEVVFAIGPIDRYFRLPAGHATLDLLAMARPGLRATLRAAIQSARSSRTKISVDGRAGGETSSSFRLDVHPAIETGEDMLLVCFVDTPQRVADEHPSPPGQAPQVAELERELDATRRELQGTVKDLELSIEDQRAINEEALSVNEEYQSTNEELLASKEELQSLNEELTALNSQLQETLERQRTTSDDLQNVLYSTNVATLFLDLDLRIRFFTPAIKALFAVVATDVGRKLTDLAGLAPDSAFEAEARLVLSGLEPLEREIETTGGTWFRRRILPYRAHGDRVEGFVITFTDVTARKAVAKALEVAKTQAEAANAAKSRFLAAASHDLRQPLQTLALLQAVLAKAVEGDKAKGFVARIETTLDVMGSMLDTLLDINQIEAGAVEPIVVPVALSALLDRLDDEFAYQARSKELELRVVRCKVEVSSDPILLEQMMRNIVSNALKYTERGGILIGCRRRGPLVRIEVWDTGIGIDDAEQKNIFNEYHQVDNAARERSRGLGLGLSIVKRLSELLDHRVQVCSRRGKGSCFTIDVPLASSTETQERSVGRLQGEPSSWSRPATILIVEDDPDLLEFLEHLLAEPHLRLLTATNGLAAVTIAARDPPDLMLADYNLPRGPNGLELAGRIRDLVARDLPVIILTGDISNETAQALAARDCVYLKKPVRPGELTRTIKQMLAPSRTARSPQTEGAPGRMSVVVVDDDDPLRESIIAVIREEGWIATGYASGEAFLTAPRPQENTCLLFDASLPGIDGVSLLARIREAGSRLPAIMITGQSDVTMAVRAMKAGAFDFIEKPIEGADLLHRIGRALEQTQDATKLGTWQREAATRVAGLTSRQRQIMELVLAGQPSKNIAADLGISRRTVENHRASIMHKTGSASLPALVRLALASGSTGQEPQRHRLPAGPEHVEEDAGNLSM